MRILQTGMSGDDVAAWQKFLQTQGFDPGAPDGDFGPDTEDATEDFQSAHGLDADGVVGANTLSAAEALGFKDPNVGEEGADWPPKPTNLKPLVSNADREAIFGSYTFVADPLPGDAENIKILGDWQTVNIVSVTIPQLVGLTGAPHSGTVQFHRLAQAQLIALWASWEAAGLLNRVLTWDGSFNPRFVRGSTTSLSNHAFGSAFDINAIFNPFHHQPALVGQRGCTRELVQIANQHGFYWGGHFSEPDGMHFEVAQIQP